LEAAIVPVPSLVDDDPRVHPEHPYSRALVHKILLEAAARHQVDPKLVLALSYWESGWDQSRVSETGAVGLMQVQPQTAVEAGPALLGRQVNLDDPYDNADVGVAILGQDLAAFNGPVNGLAAYYQGPTSLKADGMFPDTQQYVEGILDLVSRMNP
jgi:N-acetylmuramoyl-L-alanine amidase